MGRINIMIEYFEFPEGATPISDYSDLIASWVQYASDTNRVEAENILKAQRKYLQGSVDAPKICFNLYNE